MNLTKISAIFLLSFLFVFGAFAANEKAVGETQQQEIEDPDLKLSIEELRKKYPIELITKKFGNYNSKFCKENFGPEEAIFNWPCGAVCKNQSNNEKCPERCYGENSPKNLVCFFFQKSEKVIRPDFTDFSINEIKSAFLYYNDARNWKPDADLRAEEIVATTFAHLINKSDDLLAKEEAELKKFITSDKINLRMKANKNECKNLEYLIKTFYRVENFCSSLSK